MGLRACPFCRQSHQVALTWAWGTIYACEHVPPGFVVNLDELDRFARMITMQNHDPGDEDRT